MKNIKNSFARMSGNFIERMEEEKGKKYYSWYGTAKL
jgi:hypothetical protein